MPKAITEKETNKAKTLAKRKSGVTRQQLAEALNISVRRAAHVIARADLEGERSPKGKATRTLVFKA